MSLPKPALQKNSDQLKEEMRKNKEKILKTISGAKPSNQRNENIIFYYTGNLKNVDKRLSNLSFANAKHLFDSQKFLQPNELIDALINKIGHKITEKKQLFDQIDNYLVKFNDNILKLTNTIKNQFYNYIKPQEFAGEFLQKAVENKFNNKKDLENGLDSACEFLSAPDFNIPEFQSYVQTNINKILKSVEIQVNYVAENAIKTFINFDGYNKQNEEEKNEIYQKYKKMIRKNPEETTKTLFEDIECLKDETSTSQNMIHQMESQKNRTIEELYIEINNLKSKLDEQQKLFRMHSANPDQLRREDYESKNDIIIFGNIMEKFQEFASKFDKMEKQQQMMNQKFENQKEILNEKMELQQQIFAQKIESQQKIINILTNQIGSNPSEISINLSQNPLEKNDFPQENYVKNDISIENNTVISVQHQTQENFVESLSYSSDLIDKIRNAIKLNIIKIHQSENPVDNIEECLGAHGFFFESNNSEIVFYFSQFDNLQVNEQEAMKIWESIESSDFGKIMFYNKKLSLVLQSLAKSLNILSDQPQRLTNISQLELDFSRVADKIEEKDFNKLFNILSKMKALKNLKIDLRNNEINPKKTNSLINYIGTIDIKGEIFVDKIAYQAEMYEKNEFEKLERALRHCKISQNVEIIINNILLDHEAVRKMAQVAQNKDIKAIFYFEELGFVDAKANAGDLLELATICKKAKNIKKGIRLDVMHSALTEVAINRLAGGLKKLKPKPTLHINFRVPENNLNQEEIYELIVLLKELLKASQLTLQFEGETMTYNEVAEKINSRKIMKIVFTSKILEEISGLSKDLKRIEKLGGLELKFSSDSLINDNNLRSIIDVIKNAGTSIKNFSLDLRGYAITFKQFGMLKELQVKNKDYNILFDNFFKHKFTTNLKQELGSFQNTLKNTNEIAKLELDFSSNKEFNEARLEKLISIIKSFPKISYLIADLRGNIISLKHLEILLDLQSKNKAYNILIDNTLKFKSKPNAEEEIETLLNVLQNMQGLCKLDLDFSYGINDVKLEKLISIIDDASGLQNLVLDIRGNTLSLKHIKLLSELQAKKKEYKILFENNLKFKFTTNIEQDIVTLQESLKNMQDVVRLELDLTSNTGFDDTILESLINLIKGPSFGKELIFDYRGNTISFKQLGMLRGLQSKNKEYNILFDHIFKHKFTSNVDKEINSLQNALKNVKEVASLEIDFSSNKELNNSRLEKLINVIKGITIGKELTVDLRDNVIPLNQFEILKDWQNKSKNYKILFDLKYKFTSNFDKEIGYLQNVLKNMREISLVVLDFSSAKELNEARLEKLVSAIKGISQAKDFTLDLRNNTISLNQFSMLQELQAKHKSYKILFDSNLKHKFSTNVEQEIVLLQNVVKNTKEIVKLELDFSSTKEIDEKNFQKLINLVNNVSTKVNDFTLNMKGHILSARQQEILAVLQKKK